MDGQVNSKSVAVKFDSKYTCTSESPVCRGCGLQGVWSTISLSVQGVWSAISPSVQGVWSAISPSVQGVWSATGRLAEGCYGTQYSVGPRGQR